MALAKKVGDLEQFKNFHSAVFYDPDTKERRDFVIHASRNQFPEYVAYLESLQGTAGVIGFNIIDYDYPMWHYILKNKNRLLSLGVADLVADLYKQGQEIINSERSSIAYWKWKFRLLDLFRIHHFHNKAKSTSLKALQVAMRWHNLQDLPFHHTHWVEESEIDDIQEYCNNDVMSTFKFFEESLKEIDFRHRIRNEYNIDCINYPDVKIGEEILIVENAKALSVPVRELRQMRTHRNNIPLKDVILPYVQFKSKEFQELLKFFNNTVVNAFHTKDAASKSVLYKEVLYDYGLGGVHGTCGSGVFRTDDEGELILVDVSSYYPNLAIKNLFYPEHLSETFCKVGQKLYDQRMEARERDDNMMVSAIKLALNGALFGCIKFKHSPVT